MNSKHISMLKRVASTAAVFIFTCMLQAQAYSNDKQIIDWDYDRAINYAKSDKGKTKFHEFLASAGEEVTSDTAFIYVMRQLSAAEYFYFGEFNRLHTPAELRKEYCQIAEMYLGREYAEMEFIAFRYKEDKLNQYPKYYERDFIYLLGIKPAKDYFVIVKVGGIHRKDLPWCGWGVSEKFDTGLYPIEELMCLPM